MDFIVVSLFWCAEPLAPVKVVNVTSISQCISPRCKNLPNSFMVCEGKQRGRALVVLLYPVPFRRLRSVNWYE